MNTLFIAIVACVFGIVADIKLLYVPHIQYELGYDFFQFKKWSDIQFGHYVGIIAIPFEAFGFLSVIYLLKNKTTENIVSIAFLAILTLIFGLIFHGIMHQIAAVMKPYYQVNNSTLFDILSYMKYHADLLSALFLSTFSILCIVIFYFVFSEKTMLSRYVAIANPLVFYLFCIAYYLLKLPMGNAIAVAGFNISFLLFFSMLYFQIRNMSDT